LLGDWLRPNHQKSGISARPVPAIPDHPILGA
jgi:hypothetical protein